MRLFLLSSAVILVTSTAMASVQCDHAKKELEQDRASLLAEAKKEDGSEKLKELRKSIPMRIKFLEFAIEKDRDRSCEQLSKVLDKDLETLKNN
jgi:hypothetical protein